MPDGQPAVSGFAFARQSHDEHGWLIREDYLDRLGNPTQGPAGGVGMTFRHDADGNVTEIASFDDGGKPAMNFWRWHKKVSTFENGNEIRTEWRDAGDKPAAIEGGFAAIKKISMRMETKFALRIWALTALRFCTASMASQSRIPHVMPAAARSRATFSMKRGTLSDQRTAMLI